MHESVFYDSEVRSLGALCVRGEPIVEGVVGVSSLRKKPSAAARGAAGGIPQPYISDHCMFLSQKNERSDQKGRAQRQGGSLGVSPSPT